MINRSILVKLVTQHRKQVIDDTNFALQMARMGYDADQISGFIEINKKVREDMSDLENSLLEHARYDLKN